MNSRTFLGIGGVTLARVLATVILALGSILAGRTASAEPPAPSILSIERRGGEWVIRAAGGEAGARLVLEGCRREGFRAWAPRAVARVESAGGEVMFRLPLSEGFEFFRVRLDLSEAVPAALFTGRTHFPGSPAEGNPTVNFQERDFGLNESAPDAAREVVESDIWLLRGETLYFFNQHRGLQIIDVSAPDAPVIRNAFSMPGVGEQMYVLQDRYAVLLAHDPCQQWSVGAESAVVVVDTLPNPAVEVARLPARGRIVESRLVGTALYLATETWQPAPDANGSWVSGTWVASFDLADPRAPVAREPLWYPGSGNVATATDTFLFVAVTDYSRSWPWRSDLKIIDITAPDGRMSPHAELALAGRLADKFKLDVHEGILRVVVEANEAPSGRLVTVLETYRLGHPASVPPASVVPLDRLELARGERLFATRFDGTRGYIVTFEQIDPLWVIDLSDPEKLAIAGELEIPGWSTYIRPMGDRLLTVGIDNTEGWRVAVQLFDVSDPGKPALLSKVPLGESSSWSEATQDEKALGVFPDAGLVLVPVSHWGGTNSAQGVQLIDLERDSLRARGFLESANLTPRRTALREDRVLAVSGRELTVANVADRDAPEVVTSLELAYPVDRVVVADGALLEFSGTTLRSRALDGSGAEVFVELEAMSVLGATLREGRLHLLQGTPATVVWEQPERNAEWIARTNPGVLVASVWDASRLPQLRKVGEARGETQEPWLSDARALWPGEGLLVWSSVAGAGTPWSRGGPIVWIDAMPGGGLVAPGLWRPWFPGAGRELTAIAISPDGEPSIVSQTRLAEPGEAAGEVFESGGLIFSSRQRVESEVIGTNWVAESVWVPDESSGAGRGAWVRVTNAVPILQWRTRHELDVVDFTQDPADPVRRDPIPIPGALQGVSHGGSLLYTTAHRPDEADPETAQDAWLDASAYDGVQAHLVDSVQLADGAKNETFAISVSGDVACVARGGWDEGAAQRVEAWRLEMSGSWVKAGEAPLSAAPGETRVFGDVLLARNGSALDLFGLDGAGGLTPLAAQGGPGCFGGDLGRGDGNQAAGVWLPFGEYGAIRIGP